MPQRVKDKRTGHEYTVSVVNPEHHEVLDKPAVSTDGRHLPAKPHVEVKPAQVPAQSAATAAADPKKEGSK